MILGLSVANFTLLHVIISLVAIVSGLVVVFGMLRSQRMPGWTALFLLMTILTSATGFIFPIHAFTPALAVGVVSLVVLAVALIALYGKHLQGNWRWTYVVAAILALWFNVFVLIVQSFLKIAPLHALAPKGNEPPFVIAQGVVLALFVALAMFAVLRFRPDATLSA